MSTLLVRLPALPARELPEPRERLWQWALVHDAGTLADHGQCVLAQLPPAGEVVATAGVRALSWHWLEIPPLARGSGGARLRSVLDSLLEDRVLDDSADLHVALGPQTKPGSAASAGFVAVCDKAWLRGHLSALETAGRPASRVIAEFAPATTDAAAHHITALADAPWWVQTSRAGVLVRPLAQGVQALAAGAATDGLPPAVTAEPSVAGAAEQALAKALPEPPRVHLRASAQVMADAWALAQASGLDLAQFDMTVSGGAAPLQRLRRALQGVWAAPAWKPARAGLVLLVLVQLVGINLWAWHEKSAIAAKRAQAKALLQETFPRVTVVVDAPLQMQREVSALRSAAGAAQGDSVEALLTAFSPYVQAQQQLSAINYVAGELTLGGLQLTDAQLAKLQSGDAGVPLRVRSEAGRLVLSAAAGSALGAKP